MCNCQTTMSCFEHRAHQRIMNWRICLHLILLFHRQRYQKPTRKHFLLAALSAKEEFLCKNQQTETENYIVKQKEG